MKRLLCAILCLCLLCAAAAAETGFDLSVIRQNDYLEIDVDSEEEVAFVESTFSTKDLSFVHSRESEKLYSSTHMDILIIDYFSSGAYPVWRLWITVSTDENLIPSTRSRSPSTERITHSATWQTRNGFMSERTDSARTS